MALHRLIYASRATDLARDDLRDILAACERNNPSRYLTGMLLFDAGAFVQLLEGPRAHLSEQFVRIAQDTRHHGVEILTFGPIECRIFPDWSMNYVSHYGETAKMLKRYMSGARFDPFDMTPNAIEQMCLECAAAAASGRHLASVS